MLVKWSDKRSSPHIDKHTVGDALLTGATEPRQPSEDAAAGAIAGIDRYVVVGRLVALWVWCLDNAPDGRLTDDVDAEILAEVMGWDSSLGKPSKVLEGLHEVGFLDVDPKDDALIIRCRALRCRAADAHPQ